ncbi:hypothetical protein FQN57_001585 [Myotisia sp. PD_48]|nr:hypothetical protein FQN57_001585 [Myotisia sp. PD_48]
MERPSSRRRIHSKAQQQPQGQEQNTKPVSKYTDTQKNAPSAIQGYLLQKRSFLLVICCCSILFLFLKLLGQWQPSPPLDLRENSDARPLPQNSLPLNPILHPDEHIFRPPTTIQLNWTITSDFRRPDRVRKHVYLINGIFPGPTVEARSGDRLIINVVNALINEGVALHWHGLHMRASNHMDGVPGVTQCPILPGGSMQYNFTIADNQSGTYWYHAHSGLQRTDGLYGGIVIHKPAIPTIRGLGARGMQTESSKYQYQQEHLLLIGDWYHRSAVEVLAWYQSPSANGNEPVPDSLLINGAGDYNCSMAVPMRPVDCLNDQYSPPQLSFDPSMSHRIRVVNTGALAGFTLIFKHGTLIPVQIDGGIEVRPSTKRKANSIGILYPGQRTDFVIRNVLPKSRRSSVTVELDPECFNFPNPALTDTQTFPILDPQISSNDVGALANNLIGHTSDYIDLSQLLLPASSLTHLPNEADETFVLYTVVSRLSRNGNSPFGYFNHTSWRPQAKPSLPLISLDRKNWDENQFAISMGPKPIWVDLIVNNLDEGPHPFHLHGHNFYVLSLFESTLGWGSYNPWEPHLNPSSAPPYDFNKAILRDTVQIPRRGHAVLRFRADNPGIWLFHCHIQWHLASGMAMLVEIMADEPRLFKAPTETCQYLA